MKTLTEMLVSSDTHFDLDQISAAKEAFKEWLKTVGLPDHISYGKGGVPFNATESTRKLLITLVDEP